MKPKRLTAILMIGITLLGLLGLSPALASFIDNGDGTVTDTQKGLIWQKSDDGITRNWEAALSYCESLGLANKNDWRLPNVRELESIIDRDSIPTIDPVFSCKLDIYWTGTSYFKGPGDAWVLSFLVADTTSWLKTDGTLYVRCVRGLSASTGVFRPSNGLIYLKKENSTGFADAELVYGIPGDLPIAGDWDGDGVDTIGVYRDGVFYLKNANETGYADMVFAFGVDGDLPVAGDWDGDGIDTIGVYRDGLFLLRNTNDSGAPDMQFALGIPGDVPIAGNWDGIGGDSCGVFRPTNGLIYLKNDNSTGYADITIVFGIPNDKPVVGDWDGDGTDTIGVYREGAFLLRNSNETGYAEMYFGLGIDGDLPISGNWGLH